MSPSATRFFSCGGSQVTIYLDTVLSSVELVNCKRMKVHIRGVSPSVAIDKTDGCGV